jgi:hypothetical protein
MVIKSSYYFLENDGDNSVEKFKTPYNCRYQKTDKNEVEVVCHIEHGPSVISHGRTVSRLMEDIPETFNGVRGFSFVSKTTDGNMDKHKIKKNLTEEIEQIFDFVRDPTKF